MADNGVREPAYAEIDLTVLCEYLKAYSFTSNHYPLYHVTKSFRKIKKILSLFYFSVNEAIKKMREKRKCTFLCLCYIKSIRAHSYVYDSRVFHSSATELSTIKNFVHYFVR